MRSLRRRMYALCSTFQRLIIPDLKNSQFPYKKVLRTLLAPGAAWLDLGCGHQLFPDWMPRGILDQQELIRRCSIFAGVDRDLSSIRKHPALKHRLLADSDRLPFGDRTFDFISANMVVEHLCRPQVTLREVHRILRPEGLFIFHTPNIANPWVRAGALIPQRFKSRIIFLLDGRSGDDVFPACYRMNSEGCIERLARKVGFRVMEIALVDSSPYTAVLGPIAAIELAFKRICRAPSLKGLRNSVIAVLQKPPRSSEDRVPS